MTNSSAVSTTTHCPQCGAALPEGTLQGLCPRCIARQAAGILAARANASAPSTLNPQPATRLRYFGDYELLEEIAHGGMGVVWKTRQVSLNRLVAVKLLLSGKFSSPEFVQRFRAEAEAAASLQHPNIVAIHEVGEHEGQQYFSMDYVDGQSLAERARNNPLPPELAADYVRTIAEAIHYAHQRGILHRDLKPSNILIDSLDQPRVTDFGLAKRLTEAELGTHDSELTVTGQVLGTPSYMSPEQAQGRRGAVTVASDVYSLGALLNFLLTGRAPFVADTVDETLRQVHELEPVAPRLFNPAVPRDLQTICLKCLEKEPRKRYPSAQALAEELERFLKDEPIQARPVHTPEKLWRWCRRRPMVASLILALHLVGAVGLAGIIWQWRRAESNAAVATGNLRESYLAQAQALRGSSKAGHRLQALEVIAQAAEIEPSLALRNEAIASLAQADLHAAHVHPVPEFSDHETFDPTFTFAAVRPGWNRVEVQRAFSREPVAQIRPTRGAVTWLRKFSPDQRYLALATSDDGTCVWDLVRDVFVIRGLPHDFTGDFSPDSHIFAIGNQSGSVSLLDLSTGQELRRLGQDAPAQGVAFDPLGGKLACWNYQRLEILDVVEGEGVRRLEIPDAPTGHAAGQVKGLGSSQRVAWSADGQLLAAGFDRRVYLWRVENGQLVQVFPGHGATVISVALSPCGEFMASASFDQTTRVWDLLTGRMLATVPGTA